MDSKRLPVARQVGGVVEEACEMIDDRLGPARGCLVGLAIAALLYGVGWLIWWGLP